MRIALTISFLIALVACGDPAMVDEATELTDETTEARHHEGDEATDEATDAVAHAHEDGTPCGGEGCEKCAKRMDGEADCDCGGEGCEKCAKHADGEADCDCGGEGCEKCAKAADADEVVEEAAGHDHDGVPCDGNCSKCPHAGH